MNMRSHQLPKGSGSAEEVPAVLAASVIVCRGEPFEILLLRRNSRSSFVPDAWVFPGGAVDDADHVLATTVGTDDDPLQEALKICGVRETLEESGLWLGGALPDVAATRQALVANAGALASVRESLRVAVDRLTLTSHWITPVGVPKRFDTWFYLAEVTSDAAVTVDAAEAVEFLWIRPEEALAREAAGELSMVFPTIKNIEALTAFDTFAKLVASRRGIEIPTIQPLLVRDGDRKKLVLPEQR